MSARWIEVFVLCGLFAIAVRLLLRRDR